MPGIAYRNESVGFHDYNAVRANITFVKQCFPVFMTETSTGPPANDDIGALKRCDNLGISWVHLEGKYGAEGMRSVVGRLHAAGVTWTADWDIPARTRKH